MTWAGGPPPPDATEFIFADASAGVAAEHEIEVDAVGGGGPEDDVIVALSAKVEIIDTVKAASKPTIK